MKCNISPCLTLTGKKCIIFVGWFKDNHKMPQGRNDSARVSPMLRMYVTTKYISFIHHKYLFIYGVKTQV